MLNLHVTHKKPFVALTALITCSSVCALEPLNDTEMSDSTGAGLAFVADNFKLEMSDTSYIKIGSTGSNDVTTGKKAEIYSYGLKFGGSDGTGRKVKKVNLGTVSNPAIFKVYKKNGVTNMDAKIQDLDIMEFVLSKCGTTGNCNNVVQDLRLSTWVDLLKRDGINFTDNPANRTRLAVILDKFTLSGSKFQLWKSGYHPDEAKYSDRIATSGFLRLNSATTGGLRVSADVRTNPSVTVTETDSNKPKFGQAYTTIVPEFGADKNSNNEEGMYWQDFDVNMPLGALGYQPVILASGGENDQELSLEIARIPNRQAVYSKAYIDYSQPAQVTAKTCTSTSCPETATHATLSFKLLTRTADGSTKIANDNYYGTGIRGILNNGSAGISPGVVSNGVNKGTFTTGTGRVEAGNTTGSYNRFEGMYVQHLKLTTNSQ